MAIPIPIQHDFTTLLRWGALHSSGLALINLRSTAIRPYADRRRAVRGVPRVGDLSNWRTAMMSRMRFAKLLILTFLLSAGHGICDDTSTQVFDRLVDGWRWSHYWFGSTGIDDVYMPGKNIKALVFWTKKDRRPKAGLCSSDLSLCIAYSGPYLSPHAERTQVDPKTPNQQAFASFVNNGFGGDESYMSARDQLHLADFESEERTVTLPAIDAPSSILTRTVPEDATREAQRLKRLLGCLPLDAENRPSGCSGTLVFAFYGSADPYWFVWRTCSTTCEYGGDAIEELTRGDAGWEVTSRGFINTPKAEVERLKGQVKKAEMLRLKL